MNTKELSRVALEGLVNFYQEREKYFANLLSVSDAGRCRADWDAPILQLVRERNELKRRLAEFEDVKRRAENETLLALLNRALPFLRTSGCAPLIKEVQKVLAGGVGESFTTLKDALGAATIYLHAWQIQYPDGFDDSEKIDFNWFMSLIDHPKRFKGVPDRLEPDKR